MLATQSCTEIRTLYLLTMAEQWQCHSGPSNDRRTPQDSFQ